MQSQVVDLRFKKKKIYIYIYVDFSFSTALLHFTSFDMLLFLLSFVSSYFLIPLWFLLWPIGCLIACYLDSLSLWIFNFCYWFLVFFHCDQKNTLHDFNLWKFIILFCGPTNTLSWRIFLVHLERCVFCCCWVACLFCMCLLGYSWCEGFFKSCISLLTSLHPLLKVGYWSLLLLIRANSLILSI